MLIKHQPKLFVQLSSSIDSYKLNQLSINSQIAELHKPDGNIFYEVSSIKEAVLICQTFIDSFNLGSSNWNGGLVIDETSNFIARISYNGRVWDNFDWTIAKEIEIC